MRPPTVTQARTAHWRDQNTQIENRSDVDQLKNLMNELRGVLVTIQQDVTAAANASSTNDNETNGESSKESSTEETKSTSESDDIVDADVT